MAIDFFQTLDEKANLIQDQKVCFQNLMDRVSLAHDKGQSISLPEFDAFGWGRFDEFLNRFEEALNSPLLEKVRAIFEKVGVALTVEMMEKLKIGLTVRGERLVQIVAATADELNKIGNLEIKEKANQGVEKNLEEGKWDNLVSGVDGWLQLEQQLSEIVKGKSNLTHLYNAVFDLALQEGPASKVAQTLRNLEDTAFTIGGKTLRQLIKLELPENPANPLVDIEAKLTRIAQGKEKNRHISGEDFVLDTMLSKDINLKGIIEALDNEYTKLYRLFESEGRRAAGLLNKHNNLAILLRENPRSMPSDLNIKKLKLFIEELGKSIKTLSERLEKSLSPDARMFIYDLLEGKLPRWNAERVFSALQELLSKGFAFEIKLRV